MAGRSIIALTVRGVGARVLSSSCASGAGPICGESAAPRQPPTRSRARQPRHGARQRSARRRVPERPGSCRGGRRIPRRARTPRCEPDAIRRRPHGATSLACPAGSPTPADHRRTPEDAQLTLLVRSDTASDRGGARLYRAGRLGRYRRQDEHEDATCRRPQDGRCCHSRCAAVRAIGCECHAVDDVAPADEHKDPGQSKRQPSGAPVEEARQPHRHQSDERANEQGVEGQPQDAARWGFRCVAHGTSIGRQGADLRLRPSAAFHAKHEPEEHPTRLRERSGVSPEGRSGGRPTHPSVFAPARDERAPRGRSPVSQAPRRLL